MKEETEEETEGRLQVFSRLISRGNRFSGGLYHSRIETGLFSWIALKKSRLATKKRQKARFCPKLP